MNRNQSARAEARQQARLEAEQAMLEIISGFPGSEERARLYATAAAHHAHELQRLRVASYRNALRRDRDQIRRDLGLVKTPYGWE